MKHDDEEMDKQMDDATVILAIAALMGVIFTFLGMVFFGV